MKHIKYQGNDNGAHLMVPLDSFRPSAFTNNIQRTMTWATSISSLTWLFRKPLEPSYMNKMIETGLCYVAVGQHYNGLIIELSYNLLIMGSWRSTVLCETLKYQKLLKKRKCIRTRLVVRPRRKVTY